MESDIEHRLTLSSVFQLPFRLSLGVLASVQSGPPLTAVTAVTQAGNGYSAGPQRANVSRDPNLPDDQRSVNRWFDTAAFSPPATYTFGNEGVGTIRSLGWGNFDFSLMRTIILREHAKLQIRGDFFNALNHTNFLPPRMIFGPSFGLINGAALGRQIQLGSRVVWQ